MRLPTSDKPTLIQALSTRYSPAQTLALLSLRKSDLTKAVLAKLNHSTARATPEAMAELVEMRLARWRSDGQYELTPHGYFMSGALARELAKQIGVALPEPAKGKSAAWQRSIYIPQSTW